MHCITLHQIKRNIVLRGRQRLLPRWVHLILWWAMFHGPSRQLSLEPPATVHLRARMLKPEIRIFGVVDVIKGDDVIKRTVRIRNQAGALAGADGRMVAVVDVVMGVGVSCPSPCAMPQALGNTRP